MLVNKSGRRLVIGRINVKNGDALPGIPYTADERKGIEKFVKKGYIVEEKAEDEKKVKAEKPKVEPKKVETPKVEAVKAEPEAVEKKVEATDEVPAYAKFSRRKKKSVTTEDGGSADS